MKYLSILLILLLGSCLSEPEDPIDLIRQNLLENYSEVPEIDRRFEFYSSDLNTDGKPEYFVKLVSPYFCGTGGCTILLFDSEIKLIQKFTVSNVFYIQPNTVNGWKVIMTRSGKNWRKLQYPYPNNPSILPNSTEIPSRDAQVLTYSKIYNF